MYKSGFSPHLFFLCVFNLFSFDSVLVTAEGIFHTPFGIIRLFGFVIFLSKYEQFNC